MRSHSYLCIYADIYACNFAMFTSISISMRMTVCLDAGLSVRVQVSDIYIQVYANAFPDRPASIGAAPYGPLHPQGCAHRFACNRVAPCVLCVSGSQHAPNKFQASPQTYTKHASNTLQTCPKHDPIMIQT